MTGALDVAKRRLRREMAARRRAVPRELAEAAGRGLAAQLLRSQRFRAAGRVALYAALPDELPTRSCFEAIVRAGRTALLPRVVGDRSLSFQPVACWEDLRLGRYGVPEPLEGGSVIQLGEGDIVLVPGVAFDAEGHRLGRGGGVYDAAFPPGASSPPLFGVGFEFQVVEAVPHGPHDRRMDAIVTESAIRCVPRSA